MEEESWNKRKNWRGGEEDKQKDDSYTDKQMK